MPPAAGRDLQGDVSRRVSRVTGRLRRRAFRPRRCQMRLEGGDLGASFVCHFGHMTPLPHWPILFYFILGSTSDWHVEMKEKGARGGIPARVVTLSVHAASPALELAEESRGKSSPASLQKRPN